MALTTQNFSTKHIEYQNFTVARYTLTSSELLDTLVTVFFTLIIFSETSPCFKLSNPIYSTKTIRCSS